MSDFKDRVKDYAEQAEDKVEDALEKTKLPRWLWPLAIAAVLIVLAVVAQAVLADDDPPQTGVVVYNGPLPGESLPSNHANAHHYAVTATDKARGDLLNHNDDDTFRHVWYAGGDPACIYTANLRVGSGDVYGISGGRDCHEHTPSGQCAYISEGWTIFAITGQSCSEAGVPLCTGPFCR